MDRWMSVVPMAIVVGGIIGTVGFSYGWNEDQKLTAVMMAGIVIMYITKDME